ncbi:MAG TPA: NB-ARC domain-containing protein, partial [Caldilineaceae bacterium]|nr:NB-ARC domain-containing protein [Caldilineaceae bacterium]
VSPMPETSALYTTMAQQLVPSTNSIPANGEEEVSELCLLLTMAETPTRLLTLTATGGSGKTRLAIQVGMRVAPHFRDGLCWVDLSLIMDERLVQQTIMKAMGLSVSSQQGYLHSLLEHLRAKEMLLLLDNCEHMIDECARVAEKLLIRCPHLKILATSREALKVAGEQCWLVPPLSVPTSGANPPVQEVLNYQAIRLFVDRARSALATFQLTTQNTPTIIQICRQLDGMPLAIELAAARMKVLTAKQIAVRLDDRFQLLKTDTRTALPRNQTLRATLDWSYELLTNEERALLQRLAVFLGGCTVEAVEYLATSEVLLAEQMPLDLLTRLIEKSLVVVQQQHDGRRCTLLETIRAYALEKFCLSADEKMVRRRHRDWFLRRAKIIAEGMNGDRQMTWLDEMDLEYENFQSAIDWCRTTPGEAPIGLHFACLMNHAWDRRGDLREGNHVLAQLLTHPENQSATATRAKALNLRGFFTFLLGITQPRLRSFARR